MTEITLHAAQRDDREVLDRLMQLYLHDFSEWLPLKLGERGFFDVPPTWDYWDAADTQAFLVRVSGELAGFIAVDRNVQLSGAEYNISYFFLARRWRGQGVAQLVVSALLSRLPGQWQIFHLDANLAAGRFWARVMPLLTDGAFSRHRQALDRYPCTFYRFESSPPHTKTGLSDNM